MFKHDFDSLLSGFDDFAAMYFFLLYYIALVSTAITYKNS